MAKRNKPKTYGGYELGKTYLCHYWGKKFTVIKLHDNLGWMDWAVTVRWENGDETTHCTTLDKRDREIA